jgi:hypothetical protein
MALMENSVDSKIHDHGFDPPASGVDAWTPERIAILIELREAKMDRRGIAAVLNEKTGSNFTKPAVCGKIDRLFPAAKPRKTPEEKAAAIRAQRDRDNAKKREQTRQRQIELGVDAPRHRTFIGRRDTGLHVVEFRPEDFPGARVHGIPNLEDHHCRFICNEDMAAPVFCGLPRLEHSKFSFCSGHHAICCMQPMGRKEPGRYAS